MIDTTQIRIKTHVQGQPGLWSLSELLETEEGKKALYVWFLDQVAGHLEYRPSLLVDLIDESVAVFMVAFVMHIDGIKLTHGSGE